MRQSESVPKKMAVLVLPMAMQNLFSALVSASDAAMLGGLSQSSLSAVSLSGQIAFVHSLFLAALMIGESILSAQYWGKGDHAAVERVLALTTRYAIAASLCFSIMALVALSMLMRLFTPDEALISLGAQYLRVVSPSYLMAGVSQISWWNFF